MARARGRNAFTWFDAVVLVLATIFGLVVVKSLLDASYVVDQFDGGRHSLSRFRRWSWATPPLFVSWNLALLALHVRTGSRRRSMHNPGLATGLVVALFSVRDLIEPVVYQVRTNGRVVWFSALPTWLAGVADTAGLAIVATWLTLWLGCWWRPEPNWLDRAGRALGWYWIAMSAISFYYTL
jgi:hypothetical protein